MRMESAISVGDIIAKRDDPKVRRIVCALDLFCRHPYVTVKYLHSADTYQIPMREVDNDWEVVS